ncbi:MAG TPA: hypothetical protein VMT90_00635 [Dehalococcoidia bacterium]|jgi:hypothetical protein|nr:hypothetical protein [Dehalococcoidia bacterium]
MNTSSALRFAGGRRLDADCTESFTPEDALAILRYIVLGVQPDAVANCPDIGSLVTVPD